MARPAARCGQPCIEARRKMGKARTLSEIGFRAAQQPLALMGGQRIGGLIEIGPRFDLDESDHRAAPGDDVDLAAPAGSGGETAFQDRIAFEAKQQDRQRFRPLAKLQGGQFTSSYHAAKLAPRGYAFNGNKESAVRRLYRSACLALLMLVAACSTPAPAPPPVAATAKPAPAPAKPAPTPARPLPPSASGLPQVAPAGGTVVAILLPLSGPSANLGAALLNAAEMALFELASPDLTLLPFDSAGTAEGAAGAARQAIGQHA